MSAKTNKLIIKEGKKDYGEEAAEETKETSQCDIELDRGDEEFEEARAEEIMFDKACAEESVARARLQKARSMAGYQTKTANNPEEEEEEENSEGNHKQREKESAARAHLERAGNLAGYVTGLSNKP